jgi:Protein of unknown function (DUF1595)/Protein of unknown function (DUF1592)
MRQTHPLSALALLIAVAACSGQVGGQGTGDPGTGGPGTGGPGTGGPGTGGPVTCTQATAPVLYARLLAPSQYNNTVADLVKVTSTASKTFSAGLDAQLDDSNVELRANAAADIARQAVATLAQWTPCASATAADAACEGLIIDRLGAQAYRHPLSAAERAALQTLFDAGVKEKDFATGLEWFLAGIFQSPDFLYQFARRQSGEAVGQVRPLPPYEVASRLAYFVWDSPPDDTLYAAAAASKLGDPRAGGAHAPGLALRARRERILWLVDAPGRLCRGGARRPGLHQ